MNDLTLAQILIDFAQFILTQLQIINNPASILFICITAHLMSGRRAKKSAPQTTIQANAQSYADSRPAPKMKETPAQAARKTDDTDVAQIEGFGEMSSNERRIVIAGLKDGSARIGKTRIGSFNINRSGQLVPQV